MKRGLENFVDEDRHVSFKEDVAKLLSLSDEEKKQMCLELLEEFDAKNVTVNGDEINLSCCIPGGFHRNGDSNPSANLNWKKMTYMCHSCGEGGGIAWFITTCQGGDPEEASKWLKGHTSGIDSGSLQSILDFLDRTYHPTIPVVKLEEIPKYDTSYLDSLEKTHPYLTDERHISQANLEECRVGYDRSTNRIVLPHFWKGDLVGWQTRRLSEGDGPKYKNTPSFPKNETIYRLPEDHSKGVLVVESVLSVVSKVHLYPWIVATFGASVTDKQCRLLSEFPRVTLWFDNDPAGWKATNRVATALQPYTDVFVVQSRWDADPADLSDAEFCHLAAHPVPWILWRQPSTLKELHYGN